MADKFTVQVCNLSTKATENDVKEFFGYCGTVVNVKLESAGKYARVAFVTFKEPYALETAVLLSGSNIRGQEVCIVPWGGSEDAVMHWKKHSLGISKEDQRRVESELKQKDRSSKTYTDMKEIRQENVEDNPNETNLEAAGRAAAMAGNVVTAMLSKGYTLSKDALVKAKELDDKHQVTATSAAKVTTMGKDAWTKAKELEEKYQVRANATATVTSLGTAAISKAKEVEPVAQAKVVCLGRDAWNIAGSKVDPYVCAGATWVSGALERGSKAAADWAAKGNSPSK